MEQNSDASRPRLEISSGMQIGQGRYTLIRELGQGGMGMVWLARDTRLDEDVALKFIPQTIRGDVSALDDLRRETLKSRRLTHPNIIRIHDLVESPGEAPFISMEYVDGPSLSSLKAQQEQRLFTWEFLQPLVQQLCEALDYAHGEKVIHRDLKPANMMLDSRGRLKLADFGIAATASESLSRVTHNMGTSGTPAYMSPQQMDGLAPRVTDDIYALGATLYELLTSKPPFYHGEITHQVRNLPPEPLDLRLAEFELANEVPPDVAALVMACLAKDPAQRPQSARAVADWIGLTFGTSPNARISSSPAAPAKSSGTLLAIVIGVMAISVIGTWWFLHRKQPTAGNESAKLLLPAPENAAVANWVPFFNGNNLSGWTSDKLSDWQLRPGNTVVGNGRSAYLVSPMAYTNLEFKADIKSGPNGNGGLFFRYSGFKRGFGPMGYEAQVDNNDATRKTGSLFEIVNLSEKLVNDNEWFSLHVIAVGNHIVILVNDKVVADHIDEKDRYKYGKLALQSQTKDAEVSYHDVKVKPLSADKATAWAQVFKDQPELQKQIRGL